MSKKVLIVEDEKAIANVLSLKLEKEGFETAKVFDGQEALDKMKAEKFDLVLLDLVMPKVDGFYVLSKLKENKDTTPVIVASNLGQEEDVVRAKQLGAKDYFIKSNVSLAEIVENIKTVLSNG